MKSLSLAFIPAAFGSLLVAEDHLPPVSPTVEQRLDELDQEIRILRRQKELTDEKSAADAKMAATVTAGACRGFLVAAADKSFSLRIGAYIQADGRFFLGDGAEVGTETFLLRRARLVLTGSMWEWLDYRIVPDFGGSVFALQDANLSANLPAGFGVLVGQAKAPVGLERLRSGTALNFAERAYPTGLLPNRDIGMQLSYKWGTYLETTVAVLNGTADGGNTLSDANDGVDIAARVWATPFATTENDLIKDFGIGISATFGDAEGAAKPTHRSPGQLGIFTYRGATVTSGDHTRVSPQLFWNTGPVAVLAEYAISRQELTNAGNAETVAHSAWQLNVGWVLTGEANGWRGPQPASPFAPGNGQWGAWEFGVRVTGIDFDDASFTGAGNSLANPVGSVEGALSIGAALSWYLNRNLKWQLDYNHTTFDGGLAGGEDRDDEQLLITRVQVAF